MVVVSAYCFIRMLCYLHIYECQAKGSSDSEGSKVAYHRIGTAIACTCIQTSEIPITIDSCKREHLRGCPFAND